MNGAIVGGQWFKLICDMSLPDVKNEGNSDIVKNDNKSRKRGYCTINK